jgi:membrane fusion protein (multidrug efflux system)
MVGRALFALATWLAFATPAVAQQVIPVETHAVTLSSVIDRIRAIGTLQAEQSIVVRPEVPGIITKIHVAESSKVRAGQTLFTLDDTLARAEVRQAQAALELSQRNFDRAVELSRAGAGTARARDEAEAALTANKAELALAQARLQKTVIAAPFAGVVGLKQVDLGAYVQAGQDLVSLDAIDRITVEFNVPERFLRFLSAGRPIEVEADALPDRKFSGDITALSPRIDAAGRSLAVRGRVPNPEGALKPGMFVRVFAIVEQRAQAVVIPEQAIVPSGDGLAVFRVIDGKAMLTPVALGVRSFGKVEIVDGLREGDTVVVGGQLKVKDGTPVRVVDPAGRTG